jgi:hypothetical protein
MHQGWILGCVAFMILCFPAGNITAEEKKPRNAIRVLEATYGGNCAGVAKGNVTKFIASACDGTDLCNYRVYYKDMGGDPAAGCRKTFRVIYVCGKNTKPETCALESVRKHQPGLQSFRSMSRIEARRKNASAVRLRFSQSLVSLRQRLSHASVRSTIQRLGSTTNPLA